MDGIVVRLISQVIVAFKIDCSSFDIRLSVETLMHAVPRPGVNAGKQTQSGWEGGLVLLICVH